MIYIEQSVIVEWYMESFTAQWVFSVQKIGNIKVFFVCLINLFT